MANSVHRSMKPMKGEGRSIRKSSLYIPLSSNIRFTFKGHILGHISETSSGFTGFYGHNIDDYFGGLQPTKYLVNNSSTGRQASSEY